MKLLIITQKVALNDDNLGFFHRWVEKFSEKLDEVYVICLWQGKTNLAQNVRVYSLGKEKGFSKIRQLLRFQKNLIQIFPKVDGVFVHMCPIYVIFSFPLAKIFNKKIILWYAHAKTHFLAKIAENLVAKILTPSQDSFLYKKRKVMVTGHGVDTEIFKPKRDLSKENLRRDNFQIFTAGRISPSKNVQTLIEAIDILVNKKGIKNIEVKIVGTALDDCGEKYLKQIKKIVQERKLQNYIDFLGGFPNRELVRFYQESDVFVNMQGSGGACKAVLEAMACGIPVVLCTPTFNDLLGNFKNEVIFKERNPQDLAEKLLNCLNFSQDKRNTLSILLRKIVVENHNLDNLVNQVIWLMRKK